MAQEAVTAAPSKAITYIVQRHETCATMNPPIMGARSGPAKTVPTVTVRLIPRPTGPQLSVDAPETIVAGDAPKQPAMKRPMRIVGRLLPNAGIRVKTAAPPLPINRGHLRPNFSEMGPQKGGPKPNPWRKDDGISNTEE